MSEKQSVPFERLRPDETGGNHAYRQRPAASEVRPERVKQEAHEALLREREAARRGEKTETPRKRPDDIHLVEYGDNGFKS